MDDLTEIVNFDKLHSYQTNPYYKRIRFREECDLIHYREAEQIIDESAKGFLEKELTKIHLNQLFAETKKSLEKSIANAREPREYIDEKIERIKQAREAGNQYSRYNALPSGKKEKQKPVMPDLKRAVNPLMMKAKIYGKMVSNENRKRYEAQPKVYKPNMANVKRLMRLQKPRNRLNEYGHYYSIRNRLLYKEEIEEFDNEFTELLLECVLFEKDHLDVQGYLEEKLRLHQFEIPKCARKLGIGTETEIEIERISNKSSNNEVSSDNFGFDSNLDVSYANKKMPVKHNIAIKQQRPPQRNDSFVKNYYDLIEDDDKQDFRSYDTNSINKNNNKVIIMKPDANSDEIMFTDMRANRDEDDKFIEDHNEETNESKPCKVINVRISNLSSTDNTDNNIEEQNLMINIDNMNKNVNELEGTSESNDRTEKPRQWDMSKAQPIENNYRINISDIINEFNLKLKARNINTINADNIPNNENNNTINATKNTNVININTVNSNYVPEPAPSKADTSTTYYSTSSVAANPNNSNIMLQQPKDLFERIIKFNSVGVHTDNIDTSKSKYLPPINEETENNEQSGLESISPTQSFMSLPPPPSEMELKLLEETFTARSNDISPREPMEINCDNSKVNLGNEKSKSILGYYDKPSDDMQTKDHVDKNFVKYVKANKIVNDDDIALENYTEDNEPSGGVHQSLIEKFQSILKN